MLRQLRSKKTAKKILIGLAIIIIPAFVLWGAGSSSRRGRGPSYAGKIFGRKVSFDEYTKSWNAVKNEAMMRYKDFDKISKQLDLKGEAWNRLILVHEAKRRRIKVADSEVIGTIQSFPFLIRDKRFDNELYERLMAGTFRTSPREFEEGIRDFLKISKLVNSVTEGISVTKEELLEKYKEQNEKIKIEYVTQSPRDFAEKIEISNDEIEGYYKAHSKEFKLPERVKIDYIEFKYTDYMAGINVEDEEIRYYYGHHIDEFKHSESIHARHILFKNEGTAKKILKKLKSGADFIKMAKEYSTGPTKDKGGDLGFFERGKMVPEFEKTAFSLEPGEISGIVKTQFGYHIIKLEEKKDAWTDEFEKVRETIKNKLITEEAKNNAYDEALLAAGSITNNSDFEKSAQEYKKNIKTTDYFSQRGMIPNIGWNPGLQKAAFGLKVNQVSQLISSDGANSNASYIIRLIDKKGPEIPPLKEIKTRVEAKLKQKEMSEAAKKSMEKYREIIMNKIGAGASFKKAAESAGLQAGKTDYISRSDYIKDIGSAKDIEEVFGYSIGNVSPVLSTQRVSCVISLTDYKAIDDSKFEEEKKEFREKVLSQKRSKFLNKWITGLKKKANLQSNM